MDTRTRCGFVSTYLRLSGFICGFQFLVVIAGEKPDDAARVFFGGATQGFGVSKEVKEVLEVMEAMDANALGSMHCFHDFHHIP